MNLRGRDYVFQKATGEAEWQPRIQGRLNKYCIKILKSKTKRKK